MQKNDEIVGVAEALGTNGEGIVRTDGVTLFVPYLLPGERAKIRVLKLKGSVGYGKALEVFTPAEDRVRPKCEAFFRCGGCQLQHLAYRGQLRFKAALVRDTLEKLAGLHVPVAPCEKSEKPFGYRNKLQLPIGRREGKNVIGFYAERSHRIVPVRSCPIHPDWAEKVIDALYRFMDTCGLDGYDEESGEGLRHIVVREVGKKYLVTLVSTYREIKGIDYFLYLLDGIFREYSFFLNVNTARTNVVFGEEFLLLKGKPEYESSEGGILFEAGPNTFLQVNEKVRERMYARALSLAVSSEEDVVIDCYAGGGLLTAMFAEHCGHAYGIELVPEASACADSLREKNGLTAKMTNLCGRTEELLPPLLQKHPQATVVLDPPRAGLAPSVVHTLLAHPVEKLLLISCNPATLARDLGLLTGSLFERDGAIVRGDGAGMYKVTLVQPYDMFPQTKHVETLICLERK